MPQPKRELWGNKSCLKSARNPNRISFQGHNSKQQNMEIYLKMAKSGAATTKKISNRNLNNQKLKQYSQSAKVNQQKSRNTTSLNTRRTCGLTNKAIASKAVRQQKNAKKAKTAKTTKNPNTSPFSNLFSRLF